MFMYFISAGVAKRIKAQGSGPCGEGLRGFEMQTKIPPPAFYQYETALF